MTKQPSYRFVGYTEPWEEKKFQELSTKKGKKNTNGESYPVYSVSNQSGLIPQSEQFEGSRLDNLDKKSYKIVEPNEFAYNPARINVGSIAFNNLNHRVIVSSLYVIFILDKKVDNSFAIQFIKSDKFIKEVKRNTEGSVREYLFYENFSNIRLLYPPSLPEQTAIGSFFQDIDQLISLQQRKLEVLKEQKKTYLKLLFPAKGQTKPALRFAGFEDEWKEVKLGEVFDIVTDYVANGSFESLRNNVKTYEKDNFAYMIRLQDASNSWKGPWLYTDEKGYNFLSKSRLFKDDILMSNVGTVGRFFQVPELDRPMTLAPNSVLIRSTSSNNQFLYFMMLTANIQDQITMRKTPGVQDKINKTDFKKVIATLPSLPEQEAIGSFFQDLDKAIAKQEEKVNQLKESKQTLLRKMFI